MLLGDALGSPIPVLSRLCVFTSIRRTLEELDLQNLNDDEAVRLLRLANDGVYDTDDMPERWQGLFGKMEKNHHL
jgi:hypothetical protein